MYIHVLLSFIHSFHMHTHYIFMKIVISFIFYTHTQAYTSCVFYNNHVYTCLFDLYYFTVIVYDVYYNLTISG